MTINLNERSALIYILIFSDATIMTIVAIVLYQYITMYWLRQESGHSTLHAATIERISAVAAQMPERNFARSTPPERRP